ncbi:SH3 domain-containing protein [Vannielia sp. SX4]|uniref:SH3 domain-containing protein n=1 Tax=Vannielia sp. SX4 TaxID=3463852 RepID=UPI004059CF16
MKTLLTGTIAALSLGAGAPGEAAPAFVAADLELRAGPGLDYAVVGTLAAQQSAEVEACVENGPWCRVRAGEETGWAHRGALSASDKVHVPVRAATIAWRADAGAEGLVGADVMGGIVATHAEADPLIEISDEAISLYFNERMGAVGSEEGASLLGAPGSRVRFQAVDGEMRGFGPGTATTVFNSR